MRSNIFIPKTLKVGFQKRNDTYTKKLAYIIYYDEKGTLRKERSWNSWKDKNIKPIEIDNKSTSGLVLNKKVGGDRYGWNPRQTYVRIYDPRDFEFEITVPNLLYILENTSSIIGKGLEGEFIYGWDGTELVIIPTTAKEYKDLIEYNKIVHNNNYIKAKDLILGATYKYKNNKDYIYMGKFDYHCDRYKYNEQKGHVKKRYKEKRYYFINEEHNYLEAWKSISNKFISIVDSNCVENYAELFSNKIENRSEYSPIDESKTKWKKISLKKFLSYEDKYIIFYDKNHICKNKYSNNLTVTESYNYYKRKTYKSMQEIYNDLEPCYKEVYLTNGKLYKKEGYLT